MAEYLSHKFRTPFSVNGPRSDEHSTARKGPARFQVRQEFSTGTKRQRHRPLLLAFAVPESTEPLRPEISRSPSSRFTSRLFDSRNRGTVRRSPGSNSPTKFKLSKQSAHIGTIHPLRCKLAPAQVSIERDPG